MARMRQLSPKGAYLSQTIHGYKGYSTAGTARETDQVFSEEILEKLSETVSTAARMKRLVAGNADPEVLPTLDIVTDKADKLARDIADAVPTEDTLLEALENGKADEIIDLDSAILEKVGNINQALSMMDLKGGVGITPDDLDSACELLDDLGNYLRERAIILAG
ncbi:MAG: hypothetical protein ABIJ00_08835 [Candidatus Eisenbacteria bacterium]